VPSVTNLCTAKVPDLQDVRDDETRTRTGDTTIFSRAAAPLESWRKSSIFGLFSPVPYRRRISANSGRLVAVWEMEAGASPNRRALGGGAPLSDTPVTRETDSYQGSVDVGDGDTGQSTIHRHVLVPPQVAERSLDGTARRLNTFFGLSRSGSAGADTLPQKKASVAGRRRRAESRSAALP
jgi:hypothetical protein